METTTLTKTQTVQECYEFFKTGNIPALLNELNDDITWSVPGPKEVPWAGDREGIIAVEEFFSVLDQAQEMLKMEPREFIEEGNKVVALGYWECKMKKTGKIVKSNWAMVFTFEDGKISRFREYSDTYRTVEALRN